MSPVVAPALALPIVLVVDDSSDDLLLVTRASSRLIPPIKVVTFSNGADAVAYVSGTGCYSDRTAYPVPALMILDLKMPIISGFDVLSLLSESKAKKPPFICVMSSSAMESDIEQAKRMGADDFETKPSDFVHLCQLLRKITAKFLPSPASSQGLAS